MLGSYEAYPTACQNKQASQQAIPTAVKGWRRDSILNCAVQFSHSVVSDSLEPHRMQRMRLPVYHQLPWFTQTHVHWVIESKHLNLRHPLFLTSIFPSIRVFSNESPLHIQVTKVLEFQPQHQSFQWIFRTDFLLDGLVGSLRSPRDSQESSQTPQSKSINSLALSFLYILNLTSILDYWKNHSLD